MLHTYIYVYIYIYAYIHIYVSMHMHIYIYTYIYVQAHAYKLFWLEYVLQAQSISKVSEDLQNRNIPCFDVPKETVDMPQHTKGHLKSETRRGYPKSIQNVT